MIEYPGSSFGLARALRIGPYLIHAEFRLLIMLSESPHGHFFFRPLERLTERDNLGDEEIQQAVERLSEAPFMQAISIQNGGVKWGPFHDHA